MWAAFKYKRQFAAVILLLFVIAHCIAPSRVVLDWPSIALLGIALGLVLAPQLKILLPFVKAIKIGETEIHLREQANALYESVDTLEKIPNQPQLPAAGTALVPESEAQYKRLLNTNVEAHILDLAVKDKQAALMRLAIEIEKEVLVLHGALGLRNQKNSGSFRNLVTQLLQHGAIGEEMKRGLMEFWHVRNQIAHSYLSDDSLLTSTLDSGIRLLRLVKAIPRQKYRIIDPKVALFSDPGLNEPITDYYGVMLEITDSEGVTHNHPFPSGREFITGEVVGWDWDLQKIHGAAYYRDPASGQPIEAWSSSAEFVGKAQPK